MKVLLITTVNVFFKERAGTFFVLLAILFGFMSGTEHHAIATFFLGSWSGMGALFWVWFGYTAFCGQFVFQLWARPTYRFLYEARLWSKLLRLRRFTLLAIGLLQPILWYGVYLFSIAFIDQLFPLLWLIPVYFILLILLLVYLFSWRINHPRFFVNKKKKIGFKYSLPRPNSSTYWSLEYLVREKTVTVLLSKLGSFLVINAIIQYYSAPEFDLRMPALGVTLAYLFNLGLSYELYRWETEFWLWGRSLPISVVKRFQMLVLGHALLILPETFIFLKDSDLQWLEIASLYLLGLSGNMLFYAWVFVSGKQLEDSIPQVLVTFVVFTLAVLYKVPVLLIGVLLLALSARWYIRGFQKKASNG